MVDLKSSHEALVSLLFLFSMSLLNRRSIFLWQALGFRMLGSLIDDEDKPTAGGVKMTL